jgi:hypothetical protein
VRCRTSGGALMPTTEAEEYLKRAEECFRLAGACIAEANRQILIFAAVHWRMLAEEAVGKSAPTQGSIVKRAQPESHHPKA